MKKNLMCHGNTFGAPVGPRRVCRPRSLFQVVFCRLMLLAAFLVVFSQEHPVAAQTSDASSEQNRADQNQQKARDVLNQMVAALGGQKWLTIANTMVTGRTTGFYQGKPTGAIADYLEIRVFPDHTRIEIGKKRNVVEMFLGNDGWDITYRGKKAIPPDQTADYIRRRDHSIEMAVRVWLKNPQTILIYDGQNIVERHLADQVTLINPENDSITIQTDAETHLPLRRSWQWRDPLYKDKNTDAEEYDNYHLEDGIPTAFAITRFHNGDMSNQRFLYHVSYNVSLPPDLFDADKTAAKLEK
jgi:hypothetical protein